LAERLVRTYVSQWMTGIGDGQWAILRLNRQFSEDEVVERLTGMANDAIDGESRNGR
jgi:hypothetical protein